MTIQVFILFIIWCLIWIWNQIYKTKRLKTKKGQIEFDRVPKPTLLKIASHELFLQKIFYVSYIYKGR
jgi:hypothetical protein